MGLTLENIQRTKYLVGLFTTASGEFEDFKAEICTEISAELNLVNADILTLPRAPFAEISPTTDPVVRCRIRNNGFTFEDHPHDDIDKFISRSENIGRIYIEKFDKVKITKIGMIIYFNIIDFQRKPTEFLIENGFHTFNYLGDIPERLSFHVNFKEVENKLNYNFNISMWANNLDNRLWGSFDINNEDIPKGQKSMSLDQVSDILKYTYNYFVDENKFLRFLNNQPRTNI